MKINYPITDDRSKEEIIEGFFTWKTQRPEWTPQTGEFLKIMKLNLTSTDWRNPRLDCSLLRKLPLLTETDQRFHHPIYSN